MIRQITKYQINYLFKYVTGNWLRIYSILKKDVIELYKKYFIWNQYECIFKVNLHLMAYDYVKLSSVEVLTV
jgi:hypothetical protein